MLRAPGEVVLLVCSLESEHESRRVLSKRQWSGWLSGWLKGILQTAGLLKPGFWQFQLYRTFSLPIPSECKPSLSVL